MASPRKFSEKIALHNQKQAEETAAFEAIMREVTATTRHAQAPSKKCQPTAQQSNMHLMQPQHGPNFGSLPNVNNRIDLQDALNNLQDIKQGSGRRSLVDKFRQRGTQPNSSKRAGGQSSVERRVDTSPYGVSYLVPPAESSWRRASSDSALHASAMGQLNQQQQQQQQQCKVDGVQLNNLGLYQVTGGRPKSCNVPGINVYPSPEQGHSIPISNNTGSLPDLSILHFPAPLTTPLDLSDTADPGGGSYIEHLCASGLVGTNPSMVGPIRISPHTSPTRHRTNMQRTSPTRTLVQHLHNGAQLSHSMPSQGSVDVASLRASYHPYQHSPSPSRRTSPRTSPSRRSGKSPISSTPHQATPSSVCTTLPDVLSLLLSVPGSVALNTNPQFRSPTSTMCNGVTPPTMQYSTANGQHTPEIPDDITQFLLSQMAKPGTTIYHTGNSKRDTPTIVISPDEDTAMCSYSFPNLSSALIDVQMDTSTTCDSDPVPYLDCLSLSSLPMDASTTQPGLPPTSSFQSPQVCSSTAQSQLQGINYAYRNSQSDCASPNSPLSPNYTPSGSPGPAGSPGSGMVMMTGQPTQQHQQVQQPSGLFLDDYFLYQQQLPHQFQQFSVLPETSSLLQGGVSPTTAGILNCLAQCTMFQQPGLDSLQYAVAPSDYQQAVQQQQQQQNYYTSSQPSSPYHSPHHSPHGSQHSSQSSVGSSVASPGQMTGGGSTQASPSTPQQQNFSSPHEQQLYSPAQASPADSASIHQNTRIPDIIFTDIEEALTGHHHSDYSRDLSNTIASLTDSFDASDLFSSSEAELKAELSPLDLDGFQMLTDSSMLTDAATEDSFRLDRM